MTFWKWSKTAASNSTADSTINWAEGQAPSSVNDSARAMMAAAAKYRDDTSGSITTGGSSTAFTATSNQSFTSESAMDGAKLTLKFSATSGASPTLAVDSLTARALQTVSGTAIPTGIIASGSIWTVTFANAIPAWIVHGIPALLADGSVSTAMLAADAVTYAKMQNVSAQYRFLARKSSGAGDVEECTLTEVLDFAGGAAQGDILYRGASDWDNLGAGSLGQQLTCGGSSANPSWGSAGGQLLHLQDSVSSGTAAQALTISTWNTRRLQTTKTNEISGASLSSNQITLPAGTYDILANSTATTQSSSGAQGLQPRLRNTTAGTTLLVGVTAWSHIIGGGASQPMDAQCYLRGRFTLASTSVLEFQNYLSGATNVNGGTAMSSGEVEVYSDVQIRRVA